MSCCENDVDDPATTHKAFQPIRSMKMVRLYVMAMMLMRWDVAGNCEI